MGSSPTPSTMKNFCKVVSNLELTAQDLSVLSLLVARHPTREYSVQAVDKLVGNAKLVGLVLLGESVEVSEDIEWLVNHLQRWSKRGNVAQRQRQRPEAS